MVQTSTPLPLTPFRIIFVQPYLFFRELDQQMANQIKHLKIMTFGP